MLHKLRKRAQSEKGFTLVPLLPMYREAEIGFILRECKVQALFLPADGQLCVGSGRREEARSRPDRPLPRLLAR